MNKLKHFFCFFCLLFSMNHAFSQEFAPVGAAWHCGLYDFDGNIHYKTIQSIGDTLIDGKNCRILDYPGTCNAIPTSLFMYLEGEKLFYHDINELYPDSTKFKLLIDFSKNTGEYWDLEYWYDSELAIFPDTLQATVDSISWFYFNGGEDSLRIQHVSLMDEFSYGSFRIFEKLGFFDGIFPDLSSLFPCDAAGLFETRCYEDSNCGFLKLVEHACDFTGTEEPVRQNTAIKTYPNPASDLLKIETSFLIQGTFQIFNLNGIIVKKGDLSFHSEIPINDIVPGAYFLKIETSEFSVIDRFIKL